MIGLLEFCMQSVASIGLVEGRVSSERDGLSMASRDRHKNREAIEKAILEFPVSMKQSMSTFVDKESKQKRLNQRDDHYRNRNRKACALHAELSNDYLRRSTGEVVGIQVWFESSRTSREGHRKK